MRTFDAIVADVSRALNVYDALALIRCAEELVGYDTPQAEALACRSRGLSHYLRGDYTMALQCCQQAAALYEELGDRGNTAFVSSDIGLVHVGVGNFQTSLEHFRRALAIQEELGNRNAVAAIVGNIGLVYANTGAFPEALEHFHRALAFHEEFDERNKMAVVLGNISVVYVSTSDYPMALEHLHRALEIHDELGDRSGAARVIGNIGNVYASLGDHLAALEHFHRARTIHEEHDDRSNVARVTGNIGSVLEKMGDHLGALEHFRSAIALHDSCGNQSSVALIKDAMIGAYLNIDDTVEAQVHLDALDVLQIDNPAVAVSREQRRAALLERIGEPEKAAVTLHQALALARDRGLRAQAADLHKALRDLALKRNDLSSYVEHNNEFTRISEEINGKDTATKLAMQAKQREIDAREREHEKHLAVLHSTLPKEVAERVARGEVVNDHYENAAVIFLDIVGFTELSSSMSSQEVIELLDDVFTQCDAICKQHNVTKIKTIGDSYMCVSFDSVVNAALCALDMSRIRISHGVSHNVSHEVSHSVSHNVSHAEGVLFRIGMHCGPVTAGVIGKERMQYDVWGDTVNVASRMESAGEPGRVHVSEALAIQLKANTEYTIQNPISESRNQESHNVSHSVSHTVSHTVSHSVSHSVSHTVSHAVPLVTRHLSLVTQLRGLIDIKGKGPMNTYWLEEE